MFHRKDQSLSDGVFYPEYDKLIIFKCRTHDTWGFIKEFCIFSILIGFFAFLLTEWLALIIVPLGWPFLVNYLLPKYYKYILISKHSISFGRGSLYSLLFKRSLISVDKKQYNEIHHIRFTRWEKKKRGNKRDFFGKIELKHHQTDPIFDFLTTKEDLTKLVKIFDSFRFHVKVNKNRSRGELMLIFQGSPRYVR